MDSMSGFGRGDYVRLHPASDYFMRGATGGYITSLTRKPIGAYLLLTNGLGYITPKKPRFVKAELLQRPS